METVAGEEEGKDLVTQLLAAHRCRFLQAQTRGRSKMKPRTTPRGKWKEHRFPRWSTGHSSGAQIARPIACNFLRGQARGRRSGPLSGQRCPRGMVNFAVQTVSPLLPPHLVDQELSSSSRKEMLMSSGIYGVLMPPRPSWSSSCASGVLVTYLARMWASWGPFQFWGWRR